MFEEGSSGDEFFDQVDQVSAGGQRLPQLVPGQYLLQIDKIIFLVSRPPKRTPLYIVECTILESDSPERPVGMQVSWSTPMNIDMGPINVKRFVGAAVGLASVPDIDASVTSQVCKHSASKDQPFTHVQVFVQVQMVSTREDKAEKRPASFPEHRFSPVAGYSWADLHPAETAAE